MFDFNSHTTKLFTILKQLIAVVKLLKDQSVYPAVYFYNSS